MQKRGQITAFIIIGLVLVISLVIVFSISGGRQASELKSSAAEATVGSVETTVIRTYIENCLKTTSQDAVFSKIGLHGGYLTEETDVNYAHYQDDEITYYVPYYVDGAAISIPALSYIEAKAGEYVAAEVDTCIDFDMLKDLGYNITKEDEIEVSFKINREDISVSMQYLITAKKDSSMAELSQFSVVLPIRLGLLYEKANEIVNAIKAAEQIQPPENYDISQHCSMFDNNVNVYFKNGEIVQLVDFKTYDYKYTHSTIYQFAIQNVRFTGECS
ncbi:MAG: hypothetical protein Q7J54_03990 [Candidatus Woesearchaeota archaeon]|nr:hypothetical protein [Candidatus Woesearchaeota archaeon]